MVLARSGGGASTGWKGGMQVGAVQEREEG